MSLLFDKQADEDEWESLEEYLEEKELELLLNDLFETEEY